MRYFLPGCVAVYVLVLIVLHLVGRFPSPGQRDIAQLMGTPVVCFEGIVADAPLTRWRQTRFVVHGRSVRPLGFYGNVVVTLAFPRDDIAPGDHVMVRGWLSAPRPPSEKRSFDEVSYWASQRVFTLMKVWSPESLQAYQPVSRWHPQAWTWAVRQRFCAFWKSILPENEADLLLGLTIGGRGILPTEFKTQCIRAGVYHIVVVSGQNVAILITMGLGFFRRLSVPRRWLWALAMGPILFYAQLTGSDPPVMRAAFMASYALLAVGLRRDPPRLYGLSMGAGILLLLWPEALFGASFQLSFAATASLLIGLSYFPRTWRPKNKIGRWLWDACAACIVVHLGIWPVLVFYFHQISLAGFITPFSIYPLAALGMFLGLLLGLIGMVCPALLPAWIIWPVHALMVMLLRSIAWFAQWRYAVWPLQPITLPAYFLYYTVLFGILFWLVRRQRYAQKISPLFMRRAGL